MFHRCQTEIEAKELFRCLAKRLHPDCGGEKELMVLLQESHDIALNLIKNPASPAQSDARNIKPPSPPASPSKPVEKVPAGDKRLEFVKDLPALLMKVEVSVKTVNFIISIIEFLNNNQFLTIEQYKTLKSVYEKLVFRTIRRYGVRRSPRL